MYVGVDGRTSEAFERTLMWLLFESAQGGERLVGGERRIVIWLRIRTMVRALHLGESPPHTLAMLDLLPETSIFCTQRPDLVAGIFASVLKLNNDRLEIGDCGQSGRS